MVTHHTFPDIDERHDAWVLCGCVCAGSQHARLFWRRRRSKRECRSDAIVLCGRNASSDRGGKPGRSGIAIEERQRDDVVLNNSFEWRYKDDKEMRCRSFR